MELPPERSKPWTIIFNYMKDGHLQFDPKWNNLRSYAHGQLRLEQAKVATAWGGGG
jgi:hypothetical protein